MIRSLKRALREIIQPINTAAVMILGVFTILWGAWVFIPFWDVFTRAPAFQYFLILPEYFWGGVAIAAGSAMMYGVLKSSYRSLSIGAMTGFLHWLVICVFFFAGDWQNVGGVTYMMIAVYCAFIRVNLAANRKTFEK